jgi:hypothetical protein
MDTAAAAAAAAAGSNASNAPLVCSLVWDLIDVACRLGTAASEGQQQQQQQQQRQQQQRQQQQQASLASDGMVNDVAAAASFACAGAGATTVAASSGQMHSNVQQLTAWLVSGAAQLLLWGSQGKDSQHAVGQETQLAKWRWWLQHSLLRCRQLTSNSSSAWSALLAQLLLEVQGLVSGQEQ